MFIRLLDGSIYETKWIAPQGDGRMYFNTEKNISIGAPISQITSISDVNPNA